jgi:outer membrane protein OmpA-like peptidoglycan-associated protein
MSDFSESESEVQEWMSLSDIMSGLMLLFLAISVVFLGNIGQGAVLVGAVGGIGNIMCNSSSLPDEVTCDSTSLTWEFPGDSVNFAQGSDTLTPYFEATLRNAFPDLLRKLTAENYDCFVKGIRIEGHTNNVWQGQTGIEAYSLNMRLSQARAASVFDVLVLLDESKNNWAWLEPRLTPNGLSSSAPAMDSTGRVDNEASRRVVLRIEVISKLEECQ